MSDAVALSVDLIRAEEGGFIVNFADPDPGRHSGLIALSTHLELGQRDDRFSMPELIRSR